MISVQLPRDGHTRASTSSVKSKRWALHSTPVFGPVNVDCIDSHVTVVGQYGSNEERLTGVNGAGFPRGPDDRNVCTTGR